MDTRTMVTTESTSSFKYLTARLGKSVRLCRWPEELYRIPVGAVRDEGYSNGQLETALQMFTLPFEQVILSSLIRHFNFEDTGARVVGRVSPTLQPMVEGVDLTGANLPLKVSFV
jgi:hypothetical protein